MWWSKHTHSTTSSFSPAFNSTGTIDRPDAPDAEELRHPKALNRPRPSARSTFNTWSEFEATTNSAGKADLCLDAIVREPISLKCHRLTIGPEAKATGEIIAQELIVYGELAGNVRAVDRIEIKKNGSVFGELTTRHIVIEDGASFKGTVQIERRKRPRGAPELAIAVGRLLSLL
jgi:hypothetical protein